MKFDLGRLGRGYLIAHLLAMTILCLLTLVVIIERILLKIYDYIDPATLWRGLAVLLVATLVLGADLLGVIRRRRCH